MAVTSSPTPAPTPRRSDPRMQTAEMAALRNVDVADSTTIGSGPVAEKLSPWAAAALVGLGGGLGALLRFAAAVAIPTVTTPTLVELPWATLWVNVLGCVGLGILAGVLEVRPGRPWLHPLLGTGLCGGFTSFSAVVLEGSAMIGADFPVFALIYAAVTLVVCLLMVVLGTLAGRRLAERSLRRRADGTGSADGEDPADGNGSADEEGTA